jgi:hypothetical protein
LPLARECYVKEEGSVLYGSYPLLYVHDEVIAELPEHCAHEAAFRMRDVIVENVQKWYPNVKCSATPALMRRWYKEAKAVYDKDGKLIPWEPIPNAS